MKDTLKRIWKAVVDVKAWTVTWNLLGITDKRYFRIFVSPKHVINTQLKALPL
jgi:hypothetical protein